jgi:intracellular septation protein
MPSRIVWFTLLTEFGPVTAFFIATYFVSFFSAVGILMGATVLSIVISLLHVRRLPLFSIIAGAFVLSSGLLTLITHNPFWIALEYTVSNSAFGIVLVLGALRGKGLLKPLFDCMFAITDRGWCTLSLRWGLFFLLVAVGSEIARMYSYDTWVVYRFVSMFVLLAFGCSQFFLARRERLPDASTWGIRVQ